MKIEILSTLTPSDVAVSAARTCYASGGLIKPEQSSQWKSKTDLLTSVFKAGHHTTLQHTHITLLIEGMSRHLIWRLLHAHPYYNSEQVSQRYAKMKEEAFVLPYNAPSDEWLAYYQATFRDYEVLIEKLTPIMCQKLPKFKQNIAVKKAQEFARYVLPQGMSAYLYHTVNIMTALRYIAVAKSLPEVRHEALEFTSQLSQALIACDPALEPLIEQALLTPVHFPSYERSWWDDISQKSEHGVYVFDVVNPAPFTFNENYGDVLRHSMMLHDGAMLGSFNSYIRCSLSADAQNQRHRRSMGVRPALESYYKKEYYIPPIVQEHDDILALYVASIERGYQFFDEQVKKIGFSDSVYALSNAHMIELVEHNDFASFSHKTQMRLCFNAQQEIFDMTYEQVKQLKNCHIPHFISDLPPCSVRKKMGVYPLCPEGERFCGIKVWKSAFDDLRREI